MMLSIVQFTHCGEEHVPYRGAFGIKPWNTGKHRRKFIVTDGDYVDGRAVRSGKLMFWGEWEPPSVADRLETNGNALMPRYLHRPNMSIEVLERALKQRNVDYKNTDPYVFGDGFKYFICKQVRKRKIKGTRRIKYTATDLSKLDRGSMILFGSTKERYKENAFFQLDTVFVVSDYIEYDPSQSVDALIDRVPNDFINISYRMAFKHPLKDSIKLRIYLGATFENRVNGMYSFVPSMIYNAQPTGFPRIKLSEKRYIRNNLNSKRKITIANEDSIRDAWNEVRKITLEQGCIEGVRFRY